MGRERQRGAIGIMAAVTLLMALICLALVIDTGRLYYEQRKLQRVADVAALEAATQSGMCGSQEATEIQGYVQASATKNGFVAEAGDSLTGTLGTVGFDATFGSAESRRVFSAGGEMADAVQVLAVNRVPSSLVLNVASIFSGMPAQTDLTARAVARRTALAGLSAGTGLASLDDQQSILLNNLLNNLLGSHLSLKAVGYQGLANAQVSLLGLSDQLRALGVNLEAGSVDSLLGAQADLAQLLNATVNAIDPTQVANLDTSLLHQQLLGAGVKAATVTLGSVLSVVAPDSVRDQALQGTVSVLDLITALAFVANRQHAVEVNTGINLGGLASAKVKLWIVEPPQIAFGYPGKNSNGKWRTEVRTAAVRTSVEASTGLPGVLTVDLGLAVNVAQGTAALDTIQCGGVGQPVKVEVYALPGIASLQLGTYADPSNPVVSPIQVEVLSGLVELNVSANTVVGGATGTTLKYDVASPADLPSQDKTASSALGASLDNALGTLASSIKVEPKILGLDPLGLIGATLSGLVSGLLTLLKPAVSALGHVVLDPLLQLLGVSLGTIDVRLIDLQTGGAELLI
ncbi:pilus assembly protein TadG-related protein [Pseudomonas nicosulfuronedens]|uniref:Protein TadG n=1 Tax=Pseudomonas nicosulfuronedens TaxID=2571105 RepID=A0A5R9R8J1_9PSED|nr:pilus assembly protein TadG-related protein [Pseudomonas nicosulfuronedens]MDH1007628.1 pilus assembly protein TadG-related protein [Pseudomonas nicosulfuronedens]MDH1977673.1 pilus assembly protein TadG-related protein [Pseudomonas nicosulfuronedens]MDH2025727.1 pilus assembly protein TadG-related protein [Pseudomonas nicosulfuronedens]TLX79261.1 protein TadG [Pseudomonas nicosulfuronedens]